MFADTAFAAFGGAVILFVALANREGGPGRAARVLELLPFRYVGMVSFSLYLWRLPLFWFMFKTGLHFPATTAGYWLNVVCVIVIGTALASITYHFVEKPALRLKRRTTATAAPVATSVSSWLHPVYFAQTVAAFLAPVRVGRSLLPRARCHRTVGMI